MTMQSEQCDRRRIDDFVHGRIDVEQLAGFERHLDVCQACRAALAAQTADEDVWRKTRLYLRDDRNDLQPLSALSECRPKVWERENSKGEPHRA